MDAIGTRGWAKALAVVGTLIAALLQTAGANAALSNVSLVASNNQVSATSVTYTFTYQVGAADTSLVVVLPDEVDGLATDNVTVTTSTDGTTFTSPTLALVDPKILSTDGQRVAINLSSALSSGNWVKIVITGLTNPGTASDFTAYVGGSLNAMTLVSLDATLATLLGLLEYASTTLTTVAQATNGITNAVSVAPALSFSVGASSHSWSLDPSGTAASTSTSDTLTVSTNASAYSIQALVSGNLIRNGTSGSSASDYIPYNETDSSNPHFGYTVSAPSGDTTGVNSSTLRAWGTSYTNLVSGWSLSGLTNSEATTVGYSVRVDYTKAPGRYTASITYRVVPTY